MSRSSEHEIELTIDDLGIIVYSPSSAAHIADGEDYFSASFMEEADVQRHVQDGSIVPFATGTPGTFHLRIQTGYPTEDEVRDADFALSLAVRSDGMLVFRDLSDLMQWTSQYPPEQAVAVPAGIHHVTLLSNRPPSGVLGDDQVVEVFLAQLDEFPQLATEGTPTLCG